MEIPPYEPPPDRFTPPREVTVSPTLQPLNKPRNSKSGGGPSTAEKKKRVKVVVQVKKEMPDIDLSLPLPPPSPTDDPLLLSGPRRARRKSLKQRSTRTSGFASTRDDLLAAASGASSSSSSPDQSISSQSEGDNNYANNPASVFGPTPDEPLPSSSPPSSSPSRPALPWGSSHAASSSSPARPFDSDLPSFEAALTQTLHSLSTHPHDQLPVHIEEDPWPDSDPENFDEEGEYTGRFNTSFVPTKQDPPTSGTRERMERWGKQGSPFPRGGLSYAVEDDEEEMEVDEDTLKTPRKGDAQFKANPIVLSDEEEEEEEYEEYSMEVGGDMDASLNDVSVSLEEGGFAPLQEQPTDDDEDVAFVDRELSKEPEAEEDRELEDEDKVQEPGKIDPFTPITPPISNEPVFTPRPKGRTSLHAARVSVSSPAEAQNALSSSPREPEAPPAHSEDAEEHEEEEEGAEPTYIQPHYFDFSAKLDSRVHPAATPPPEGPSIVIQSPSSPSHVSPSLSPSPPARSPSPPPQPVFVQRQPVFSRPQTQAQLAQSSTKSPFRNFAASSTPKIASSSNHASSSKYAATPKFAFTSTPRLIASCTANVNGSGDEDEDEDDVFGTSRDGIEI